MLKQDIRVRFRDSNFEFKLSTKMYELQVAGTQQEHTSKLMLPLLQATVDMPEVGKHWLY